MYKLEPSAGAAIGLANKALRDKDYDTAIKYYHDGARMETDKNKASDYMLQLAGIFSNQRNFARSRQAHDAGIQSNNGSESLSDSCMPHLLKISFLKLKRGLVFAQR